MEEQPVLLPGLNPREAALDAYYRISWALDFNDWKLFESGWAKRAPVEFHIDKFNRHLYGLEEIRSGLYDVVAALDTQHVATNARVYIEPGAKTGRMWVMTLNQHFRKGQGDKAGAPRLWGGNQYRFEVVEEDGVWLIKEWHVEMGWNEGDLTIVGQ